VFIVWNIPAYERSPAVFRKSRECFTAVGDRQFYFVRKRPWPVTILWKLGEGCVVSPAGLPFFFDDGFTSATTVAVGDWCRFVLIFLFPFCIFCFLLNSYETARYYLKCIWNLFCNKRYYCYYYYVSWIYRTVIEWMTSDTLKSVKPFRLRSMPKK